MRLPDSRRRIAAPRRRRATFALPLLLLFALGGGLAACAAGPANGLGEPRQTAGRITPEQVRGGPQTNAFDLVQGLRPQWLRQRADGSSVMVYLDGRRFGEVHTLRDIAVPQIDSLDFIDPIDAMARYGMGHENGVISITSRR
jgi:hypothetical protein